MKGKQISASLPQPVADKLELWAKQSGESLSGFTAFILKSAVREAIRTGELKLEEGSKE